MVARDTCASPKKAFEAVRCRAMLVGMCRAVMAPTGTSAGMSRSWCALLHGSVREALCNFLPWYGKRKLVGCTLVGVYFLLRPNWRSANL